jgi:hypothetical protein
MIVSAQQQPPTQPQTPAPAGQMKTFTPDEMTAMRAMREGRRAIS